MGKPTGFMEFGRENNPAIEVKERIKNYLEFHPPLDKEARRKQGARCMNCGVPFCQSCAMFGGMYSGCPLHNLIPEWNDEIYAGNWKEALSRLRKTNNFPEFTGRVCPALCEAACTCGMNDLPVTIHENELAIVEEGFKNGWIKPEIPTVRSGKRVAVVGSGPAGLTVADQLNKRGHNVVVFERDRRPGGLLMYGIPNMKLEKRFIDRRISIMKEEGIEFLTGINVGVDITSEQLLSEFDAIVLCCGSKKPRDLNVSGRDAAGVYFAVDFLSDSTRKLIGEQSNGTPSAEGKNVIIVGGGDTGNDCVGTCIRQGAKSVIQLEMMPKLPDTRAIDNPWPQWPRVCKTDYGQVEAIAVFGHDPRIYQTTVKEIVKDDSGNIKEVVTVKLEMKKDEKTGRMVMSEVEGSEETLPCELLLIAAGFIGCEDYVAKALGVELSSRGTVATGQDSYKTNIDKIFVAGDARRGQSLVVWAIAEGRACAHEVDEFLMGYSNML
jgi:glutamate synthase (NADPH/NADH) small chain